MPIYYLLDNLTIDKQVHKRYTLDPLTGVSDKSIRGLIEQKRIRQLQTPPLSVFEPLKKYAKLLEGNGISNLGDFAYADLNGLKSRAKAEIIALQKPVRDMLHPDMPLNAVDCGCGDSPEVLPTYQQD